MSETWSIDRLIAASGESAERLSEYAEAGLLQRVGPDSFAADSLRRLRLIAYALQRGISDEELILATKQQGDLLGIFTELGSGDVTDKTLAETGREAGVPAELQLELIELLGVDESDVASEEDAAALELFRRAMDIGMPHEALKQLMRVFADATERLAGGEVRIFHDHVHERFRSQGLTGRELLSATHAIGKPALDLAEPAIIYFHRRALHRANREDFLRHLAELTTPPAARPGETEITVMFVDLAGFTPLTVALGDHGVADVLQRFAAIVRRNAEAHGGRIIKQIGDAFMLVFARPADAIPFGLALLEESRVDPDMPALHIGAHFGRVLHREGDYFGNGVNLAARVTSASEAAQFLITPELETAAAGLCPARYVALAPRELKGVAQPVPLVEVGPV